MKTIFFFFLTLFLNFSLIHAQKTPTNSEKLGIYYYEKGEFDKANVYLEELFETNPYRWHDYYFNSLLHVKDYNKAEKITKKLLKQNKQDVYFYVYLAKIYKQQEDTKREQESYEKAIKELSGFQKNVEDLAGAFINNKLYDYAIATYNKGRKTTPDFPYYYERAEVYKTKNDLASMINEYLDALEYRESDLMQVQRNLQNSLGYDDEEGGINNPLLKQELQKRILKNPDKIVLIQFLIFIQKQQKDFEGAFVQSKALEKRLKGEGEKIFELAKICTDNGAWETALKCYQYLIDKGPSTMFYEISIIESLQVEYLALSQKSPVNIAPWQALEQKLTTAYQSYTSPVYRILLLNNLARAQAYYLNKTNEAIQVLDEFISLPGIENTIKSNFKILLGDIYLLKGEIWEASLLYSQVEKDFKYESIGQEAKFKNAKLSFYAGDFTWAKTQADVLKGATTKLIANDALDLSLVISDAIGVDTNDAPLKLYSSAELLILQHRYTEAIQRLDSINLLYSGNTLGDDINYKKAGIYISIGKYVEAETMYKNILEYYADELYGDDAQFKLAELYERCLNNKEKSKQAYQDVMTKYPGSIYTVEARKRFRLLRGDQLNN